jgi:putative ABC transport system substrate-binding protein
VATAGSARCSRRALLGALGGLGLAGLALGCRAVVSPAPKLPRSYRVGFLSFGSHVTTPQQRLQAFRAALADLGYVEDENLLLDLRYADEDPARLAALADELVALPVDVLVAAGTRAILAAQAATRSIPIVMAVSGDPVGTGLVPSLARPGGNVTGVTDIAAELSGKRLELLREIAPTITRVAVVWNPAVADQHRAWRETERAARVLGLQLQAVPFHNADDLPEALEAAVESGADALTTLDETLLLDQRRQVLDFAIRHRLPTIYSTRECVEAGGLMAYGPSLSDLYRRAAVYVDKLLKGATASTLPVERPTRFELVVNRRVARALGLTIPTTILAEADDVLG